MAPLGTAPPLAQFHIFKAVACVLLTVFALAACAGDDDDGGAGSAGTTAGAGTPGGTGGSGGTAGGDGDGDGDGDVPDLRACQAPSDCVVMPTTCCPCGQPEPSEVTAINADHRQAFFDAQCPPPVACPPIYCPPEPPRFVATCTAGTCAIIDLNEQAASACDAPADCRVRTVGCCECNAPDGPGTLVAVSDATAFASLVCDPDQGCDECEASYPAEVTATCNTSGLCELNDPRE